MPDDQLTEVTEPVDQEIDENAAFLDEDVETPAVEETVVEDATPKEEPKEENPEKTETDDTEATETETGDDILRGKEILEAEQKEKEERESREREEAAKQTDTPSRSKLSDERFEKQHLEVFHNVLPKNLFPKEPVKLNDGTELDFNSLVTDYPEIPYFVAGIVNNLVRQMTEGGYLVSNDHNQKQIGQINEGFEKQLFVRTVTHPEYGVPKAAEIADSKKYKEWLPEQPEEIQALLRTNDPWNHIRVLKRFLNKEVLGKAEEEVSKKDKTRKAKKENFDAIHKTTIKSTGKRSSSMSPEDEEAAAFYGDDDE
jgi:hypothetical protein